jgi:hypothetical protein
VAAEAAASCLSASADAYPVAPPLVPLRMRGVPGAKLRPTVRLGYAARPPRSKTVEGHALVPVEGGHAVEWRASDEFRPGWGSTMRQMCGALADLASVT